MHLKRMELYGFKSFAEKTELDFSPGIAAVIGPNGCGKSNLVDAVRWALGEQSVKSLRGTRMDEVIFSGSDNRKPLNFAEVSLTFSDIGTFLNLDFDEITITRRLFRSGDSEYYINKSPCRLRDITEMFLDTGLGKDVYSVIGQGRVEEIINSRPEERREIFEEAAGILKYKIRKREARRRLEETKDNLVRVQDLIFELETQIEPLQAQAEVTRRYRDLKKMIEDEEKRLLSYNLIKARAQLEKVTKQLQSVNDALLEVAAKSSLHEEEFQALKNRQHELMEKRNTEEQEMRAVSKNLDQQQNELLLLAERENHYKDQLDQNQQRIKQLEIISEELGAQKEMISSDILEKEESLQQAKCDLDKYKSELSDHEDSELANEVQRQQDLIYQSGVRKETAQSTIEELQQRLNKIESQVKVAREQQDLSKKEKEACETDLLNLEKYYNNLKKNLDDIGKEKAINATQKEQSKAKLDGLNKKERQKHEEVQGIKSRLQLLEEQESAMSGYYRGVKEVMQAGEKLPGIIGPVADLITLDNRYVQAIESALGSSMQYLVASTEQAVFKAINYLKEHKYGWATFLPLNIIHQGSDPLERFSGWRDQKGVIGKASELVKVENEHRKVANYLLSSILVCNNMKDASEAAKFIKYSCRVVTLDGEMINPGGIIRGGSIPRRSANQPLSRKKEIDALQETLNVKLKELYELEEELKTEQSNFKDIEDRSIQTDNSWQDNNQKITEFQRKIDLQDHNRQMLAERLNSNFESIKQLELEKTEAVERISQLETVIKECTERIQELNEDLAGKKDSYEKYLGKKKELEQLVTEAMVKVGAYKEQYENLKKRYEETELNTSKPVKEKEQIIIECKKLESSLAQNKEKMQATEKRINELEQDKVALIKAVEDVTQLLSQVETELIELDETGKKRQGQQSRQERREKDLTVEQTRLQTEINYQEMRFRELFQTMEMANLEDDFNPEESGYAVANLKEDLELLGEVNLGAIEELSRLEERINFLKDQRDDLNKGEESLRKVLAEIDERMEYYFNRAFEEICTNFKATFQELFEGGQVILRLTDKDDILESGIEIVAQPPGKKLQNITLLSAGEKVLTAIALVFAILRYKPAPFYLLDEVESMLDDANLARFTNFLKQSSSDAQFILITHRRRTMEEAKILYGVTMPEPGISKLISVKPGSL